MSNECIPYFAGADQITGVTGAVVNGKQFVNASGTLAEGLGISGGVPTVETNTVAGAAVLGVGAYDSATGLPVGVWVEGTVPVVTSAAVVPGPVMSDANGFAVQWVSGATPANIVAGYCIGAAAAGADAPVKIRE